MQVLGCKEYNDNRSSSVTIMCAWFNQHVTYLKGQHFSHLLTYTVSKTKSKCTTVSSKVNVFINVIIIHTYLSICAKCQ